MNTKCWECHGSGLVGCADPRYKFRCSHCNGKGTLTERELAFLEAWHERKRWRPRPDVLAVSDERWQKQQKLNRALKAAREAALAEHRNQAPRKSRAMSHVWSTDALLRFTSVALGASLESA